MAIIEVDGTIEQVLANTAVGLIKNVKRQEPRNCLVEYHNGFAEVIYFENGRQAAEFKATVDQIKKALRICKAAGRPTDEEFKEAGIK